MKQSRWRERLFETTRGKILALLRYGERTVDDLARELGLTDNAVRAHLLALLRDGLVARCGVRPGVRKPHALYALTHSANSLFSNSYGRLLDLVLQVLRGNLAPGALRDAMRQVGRRVPREKATEWQGRSPRQRATAALRILEQLGGAAMVERSNGTLCIRGAGCPFAEVTATHPEACLMTESMLTEIMGRRVREKCQRQPAPSCWFEISAAEQQREINPK